MNTTKVAFLLAVGLTMGSAMVMASAADASTTASGKPAASGMMGGYSHHMHGAYDSCKHEHDMMDDHGHGYGNGMMGGIMGMMDMMGGGMMESPRAAMVRTLSLSDEQRVKINKLSDKLHHDNWAAMGAIMDESAKLRDLYEADKRDPDAIGKVYQKIFDTKIQMIKAMVTTENQIEDLLTNEQRTQLKDMRHKMGSMHGYSMMH
jgi:Spy/CpxP family protein refolding chaperone